MSRFQHKSFALNSDVLLSIKNSSELLARRNLTELAELIRIFEQNFSRFLPESQLSVLNRNAGKKIQTSPELLKLIKKTIEMAKTSGGLYNPFVLPALQSAGYLGSWPKPEKFSTDLDFSARSIVPADQIEIGTDWIRIPADSALDFGGIGKGYLLDELAEFADKNGVNDYWFSLGGDIIVRGDDEGRTGWQISIAKLDSDRPLDEKIETGGEKLAIATSGIIKRKGIKNNQPWHHLIDPRTSRPAETDILAATVVADSATEADIWAKSIVILGSKAAKKFGQNHKIKKIILQRKF